MKRRAIWESPTALLLMVSAPWYVAAFLVLRPDQNPQTWEPGEIAAHLVAGEGYSLHRFSGFIQPTANQEPMYTLLLAFFLGIAPRPYISLIALQVFAWLASARLLGRLAHRLVGAPETWSTLVVSLWPPILVYVLSYHPLWMRCSALVLAVAAAVRYRDQPGWPSAALLGTALGLASLVRSVFLVLPLVFIPWSVLDRYRKPVSKEIPTPTRLAHGAITVIAAISVLSPWVIRNHIVLGAWIPGTSTAGYTALAGNHPGATGDLDRRAVTAIFDAYPPEIWKQPEPVRDAFFRERVLAFWKGQPQEAVLLFLRKLLYLWTWRPGIGTIYPGWWTSLYVALWATTLPLLLIGWRLSRSDRSAEAPDLLFSLWALFSLVYALFVVNMRYRFESEPLLVPYALVTMRAILDRTRRFREPVA